MDMACSTHLRAQKFSTSFWFESLNRRDPFEYRGVDWKIILKLILKAWGSRLCTIFTWLGIGMNGRLL